MSTIVPESSRQGTEAGHGLGDPTQLDEVLHSSFSLCCRDGSKLWTSSWQHLPTCFKHQPYATSPRFSYHISSASGDLASSTKSVHSKHGTRSTRVCSGNPWIYLQIHECKQHVMKWSHRRCTWRKRSPSRYTCSVLVSPGKAHRRHKASLDSDGESIVDRTAEAAKMLTWH